MTTVLLIDNHPIVFRGCRGVLQDLGIDTVYEATSVVSGYRAFLRNSPDVVVVDLTFQGDDLGGLSLIQRIMSTNRNARVMVFSMHNDPAIVSRALESGALSYVVKDMQSSELATALSKVAEGKAHLSHNLAIQVAMLQSKSGGTDRNNLSPREKQILSLLGKGNTYDQIATKLGVSYKTVTNSCSSMRGKLQVRTLADLIRFAIYNDPDRVM